jgi:hypothetical protein
MIFYGSLYFIVLVYFINIIRKRTFLKILQPEIILSLAIVILIFSNGAYAFTEFKILDFIKNKDIKTPFSHYYEDNYVFPTTQNIHFKQETT